MKNIQITHHSWLRSFVALVAVLFASISSSAATITAQSAGGTKSIGLVVYHWANAIYETPFMDECPDGPAIDNDEIWWRALSGIDREKFTKHGEIDPTYRAHIAIRRGPKGEDVCWNPTVVKDPPLRTVEGTTSFGFNLDGTSDGHATPKSCAHKKFTSPDGKIPVDNQVYRLLGCNIGWRHTGVVDGYTDPERRASGRGLILIEITGVENLQSDGDVTVQFFRSRDPLMSNSAGRVLPYATYRVDADGSAPRYGAIIHGKLSHGHLNAQAGDVNLPFYGDEHYLEMVFRDGQLSLDFDADGTAKGLFGGYFELDKWLEYLRNLDYVVALGDFDCPALYEAAHRLADGYPDPKTGNCTALSSTFDVEAVPAFIVHPAAEGARRSASNAGAQK